MRVDAAIIKGDIADAGLPEQFEAAARVFSGFDAPHHAFLGNHDYCSARRAGRSTATRCWAAAGAAPLRARRLAAGAARDGAARRATTACSTRLGCAWLATPSPRRGRGMPTLLLMHHQPVPPEHRDSYPNSIGMRPDALAAPLRPAAVTHPQVKGVLIGHTHRNRVRRYPARGTRCRSSRSTAPRTTRAASPTTASSRTAASARRSAAPPSERALAHSTRCRELFRGNYQHFVLGSLAERSYVADA